MTPGPLTVRVLAVALLLAVGATGCAGDPANAATVGDGAISVDQLQEDVALYGFLTGLSGASCGTPVEGESQESACARFALGNDIREELTKTYAAQHDLTVEPKAVDDAMTQLTDGIGGNKALRSELADAGVTRAQVEELAGRLLLVNAVQSAVADERLDDAALRASYEQDLPTYTTIEVEHILVPDRADAERIARQVTPETFAEFARSESIDTGSASKGGNLGSFSEAGFRAQFDPDFVAATLALRPGEISEPVRTQFGWHVIHLVRKDVAAFEDVRDQLRAGQIGTVFNAWFDERFDSTDIVVNPRFGRFDPDTGQVLPIRSTAEEPTGPTGATAAP